jgi:mTERF domain-containing protein
VNGKLKPVVDLLLGMGVSVSDLPTIVLKRPQIFGCSPEENLKPTAAFLEGLGVERGKWGKILVSFPHILTYSHSKLQHVVEFLLEIGLSMQGR